MKNKKFLIIFLIIVATAVISGYLIYTQFFKAVTLDEIATGVDSADFDDAETAFALSEGENKITSGGTYRITGSVANGSLVVDTDKKVKLILDNVSITNASGPAINVVSNKNVYIELVGTNTLDSAPTEEENGAIYSKADLAFTGDGSLTISSTLDGIVSKDDLEIDGGTFTISATDDGIVGKDSLKVTAGTFDITAGDDGLKSSNDEDETKGNVEITGGTFAISAGDDGIHAEQTVKIDGGDITVATSYEGIEGTNISVSGGKASVTSSDDGFNVSGGNDASGGQAGPMTGGGMDQDSGGVLAISGGEIYVNATGDGLDSNGSITMSGGTVYVDGPADSGNGALDYNGTFEITGGTLIAVGMSGMAQNASSASQPSVMINLSSTYSGTLTFGNLSFTPARSYNSIVISSPELQTGSTYDLTIGGTTVQSVTISQNVTSTGTSAGMGGGMQGGMRR